jgi:hypothetical protein
VSQHFEIAHYSGPVHGLATRQGFFYGTNSRQVQRHAMGFSVKS